MDAKPIVSRLSYHVEDFKTSFLSCTPRRLNLMSTTPDLLQSDCQEMFALWVSIREVKRGCRESRGNSSISTVAGAAGVLDEPSWR